MYTNSTVKRNTVNTDERCGASSDLLKLESLRTSYVTRWFGQVIKISTSVLQYSRIDDPVRPDKLQSCANAKLLALWV